MVSYDLTITRGITSEATEFVFNDDAGTQVDLAGWSVFAQVRKRPHKAIILDLMPYIIPVGTLLGYEGEVDGPGRVALGAYTDEQTLAMADIKAEWDLVLQDPLGQRLGPFVTGNFTILTIITEPE